MLEQICNFFVVLHFVTSHKTERYSNSDVFKVVIFLVHWRFAHLVNLMELTCSFTAIIIFNSFHCYTWWSWDSCLHLNVWDIIVIVNWARRNKRACHEKFTDAEHSTFQVCLWSEDVLLYDSQYLELHG